MNKCRNTKYRTFLLLCLFIVLYYEPKAITFLLLNYPTFIRLSKLRIKIVNNYMHYLFQLVTVPRLLYRCVDMG